MENIFKLVDSCNQYSRLFRLASEDTKNDTFRDFAQSTRQLLDRFSYELRTEIRRIAGIEIDAASRTYAETKEDADLLLLRCEIALKLALDEYQRACVASLPAHARAMLKRQRSAIELAYDKLVVIRSAA